MHAGSEAAERFLVDGKELTAAEARATFAQEPFSDRQQKVLDRVAGDSVLDVGCYAGAFVAKLVTRHPQKSVTGIDYFDDNVRLARLLHPELADRFQRMSAYALEFSDDSFDCITLQEVIEHLEGAAAAVKEINRVLKPGGFLLVSAPNPFYWRHMMLFFAMELRNTFNKAFGRPTHMATQIYFANVEWNRHVHAWTPDTLMTLMAVNGFAYVEHCYERAGNVFERGFLKLLPFLGPTQILKVRKIARARADLV